MPYFWPSRGLQVRGLNKSSREPTELNTHSIRYEPWNMRLQASSMQDRCAKTPKGRATNITGPKGRRQLQCAMTIPGYNDTSAQSQPCRNAGSRNEGGSVRPAGKGNAL